MKNASSYVLARHRRLTISAASTCVPRFIQRGVNLKPSMYVNLYASGFRSAAALLEDVFDDPQEE